MTDLEQIALKIACEIGVWNPGDKNTMVNPLEFARRLVAALGAQESVATKLETRQFDCFHVSLEDSKRLQSLPIGTQLYAAPIPSTCPACAQKIDAAAKAGMIVDEQIPDGWQLVPNIPTEKMILAGVHHENMGDMEGRYNAMLAAAPEYKP